MSADEICRRLLTDYKARGVFLVDYCDREVVARGDMSREDAERLIASMQSETDEEGLLTLHLSDSLCAIRERFARGGYVLFLFECDQLVNILRMTMFTHSLARFAAPPERTTSGDPSSGAPAHVAAWRR